MPVERGVVKVKNEAKTILLLKSLFGAYYRENDIPPPPQFSKREFGFMLWDKEGMIRHKTFYNRTEFLAFLRKNAPKNAYRSAAYYLDPEAQSMEGKGWIGADLIFDIDADHLITSCKEVHDRWICIDCGIRGTGKKPAQCPSCKSTRIDEVSWICDQCLNSAKEEVFKLLDFLFDDFGISEKEVKVVYSGHRGYHVHVDSETVRELSSDGRREIINYITGTGIKVENLGLIELSADGRKFIIGPDLTSEGWGKRLVKSIIRMFSSSDLEDTLRSIGIPERKIKILLANRERLVDALSSTPSKWDFLHGIGISIWEKIALAAIKRMTAQVDEPVSVDVHRLIRLEYSLHGSTGFKVTPISVTDLERFDPFKDAIVFKGEKEVIFREYCPEFRIGDELFGPYQQGEKVELPLPAVVFTLAKDVAELP